MVLSRTSDETQPHRGDPARRRFLLWMGLAVLLFTIAGLLVHRSTRPAAFLSTLSEPERKALYERSLRNLNDVCSSKSRGGIDAFCREQAELIVKLPDCDDECRKLASPHLKRPSR